MFVFAGYLLFAPLAGLGFFLYPWGLILSFARQPRTPISKAEFLRRGRSLVTRAVQIKAVCGEIKQEIKLGNHSKGLRRRAAALRRQCLELEKDDHCLHRVFPSGDDPELVWSFRTLRNYGTLAWGIVAAAISAAWVANTVVYLLPGRPVSLGLNVLIAFVRSASVGAYFLNVFDLLLLLVLLLHVQQCTYAILGEGDRPEQPPQRLAADGPPPGAASVGGARPRRRRGQHRLHGGHRQRAPRAASFQLDVRQRVLLLGVVPHVFLHGGRHAAPVLPAEEISAGLSGIHPADGKGLSGGGHGPAAAVAAAAADCPLIADAEAAGSSGAPCITAIHAQFCCPY
uniref:Uncharacterized protein n=2 Tax=Tetraselmis sp. GSL018 TaxID=582737 RepID=A0A061RW75_9CHLO